MWVNFVQPKCSLQWHLHRPNETSISMILPAKYAVNRQAEGNNNSIGSQKSECATCFWIRTLFPGFMLSNTHTHRKKSNARKVCAAIKRVTDWLPALCNLEFLFEFAANFLFPNKKIMAKIFEVAAAAVATPLQDVPLQKLFKSYFCGGREVKWYRFCFFFCCTGLRFEEFLNLNSLDDNPHLSLIGWKFKYFQYYGDVIGWKMYIELLNIYNSAWE